MHAIAHGGVRTPEESALKVDWEKNPLPHRGIEPASAACRSDALPTETTSPSAGFPAEGTLPSVSAVIHCMQSGDRIQIQGFRAKFLYLHNM